MNTFLKSLLCILCLLYLTTVSLNFPNNIVSAANYFEDDFSSGTYNKWEIFRGDPSNFEIYDGALLISQFGGVSELVPKEEYWPDLSLDHYIYEVDITPLGGVDRNISFRIQAIDKWQEIHHTKDKNGWYRIYLERVFPNGYAMLTNIRLSDTKNQKLEDGVTYHFKIIVNGTKTKVYITEPEKEERLIIDVNDPNTPLVGGRIGVKAAIDTFFDNVKVTLLPPSEIEEPLPTMTATPTAIPTIIPTASPTPTVTVTPTMTPTPTPTPTVTAQSTPTAPANIYFLSVPDIKQYSQPWKDKIYGFTKNTIEQLGCALTSAVMILRYHGHYINPDDLNDWLKQQSDGYISGSLINWLAISRYTKQHDSNNSPTLEYKRLIASNSNLDIELNNNRPAILKEPNHFVVVKGKTDTTYLINDPAYANRTDLFPYNNVFSVINSYRPTHSDLSYMMFTANSNIVFELLDSNGKVVDTQNFIEEPIDINEEYISMLLLEKPISGKYQLKITGGNGSYELNSYLYNINGEVVQNKFTEVLLASDSDIYKISYDSQKGILKVTPTPVPTATATATTSTTTNSVSTPSPTLQAILTINPVKVFKPVLGLKTVIATTKPTVKPTVTSQATIKIAEKKNNYYLQLITIGLLLTSFTIYIFIKKRS